MRRSRLPPALLAASTILLLLATPARPASEERRRELPLVRVRSQALAEPLVLIGVTEPRRRAELAFEVPGRVREVLVREGDAVEEGQVLARLDGEVFRLRLAEAEAAVATARAELAELAAGLRAEDRVRLEQAVEEARALFELAGIELGRLRELSSRDATTRAALDRATSDHAAARARLEQARSGLDRARAGTRAERLQAGRARLQRAEAARDLAVRRVRDASLRAPFPGRLAARHLDEGALVQAGTPALTLAEVSVLQVRAASPPRYREAFRAGTEVRVQVEGEELPARIRAQGPGALDRSLTVPVYLDLPDPERRLRPGLVVRVIGEGPRRPRQTLPPTAVLAGADGTPTVMVAEPAPDEEGVLVVRPAPVRVRWLTAGLYEVLDGLEDGAAVVRRGGSWLLEGDRIRPAP